MRSDSERRVTRIVGRQPLLPPLHEEYYASDDQTAYKRHQQKDAARNRINAHQRNSQLPTSNSQLPNCQLPIL